MIREEIANISMERKALRNFGLLVGGVFLLIGVLLLWRHGDAYPYFLALGGTLAGLGLAAPGSLRYPYRAWMVLAVLLGWVMTHIIVSVLFFLVLTPIAVISRMFNTRHLDLAWRSNAPTYWVKREKEEPDPEAHEKQY